MKFTVKQYLVGLYVKQLKLIFMLSITTETITGRLTWLKLYLILYVILFFTKANFQFEVAEHHGL